MGLLPEGLRPGLKIMIFVDGENLTLRYQELLKSKTELIIRSDITHEQNVYVWSSYLNMRLYTIRKGCEIVRKYYYTSVSGDEDKIKQIEDALIDSGIEAPRVYKRTQTRGSKKVDISLATDMLTHAFRKNYDIAILVAGDQDYVPLVDAVMMEGCRVVLWFLESGISPELKKKVDFYSDIGNEILFSDNPSALPLIYG